MQESRKRPFQTQDSSGSDTFEPPIQGKRKEKRNAHTAAEQKRRDTIKVALDQLQQLIPGCTSFETSPGLPNKKSKAQILQKAIEYVTLLTDDRDKKNDEILEMEKKLVALKIVKENYEKLVLSGEGNVKSEVSDNVKFTVFQQLMSTLLESFRGTLSVGSFHVLSGSMIRWVEDYCKPEIVNGIIVAIVKSIFES